MSLAPLANTADLSDRGIDVSDADLTSTMLGVASASIRNAAGCPISQAESTVTLDAWGDTILQLPGVPIVSVDLVSIEAVTTTDYRVISGGLWRRCGWGNPYEPSTVVVTYTHGMAEVPADIVDLCCNLTAAGQVEAASLAAGGSFDPRVVVESIDDYRVQFTEGADAFASVFDLPAGTRSRLRSRFGGGAGVLEFR